MAALNTVFTINDGSGNPLDGVNVWVTTDAAGTNVVTSGYTGDLGTVTLQLDAGSYYVWKQLSHYNPTNPEACVAGTPQTCVLAAASGVTAYCTAAQVKIYKGVSGSGSDTLITNCISRAQAWIDRYCGTTFAAATNTVRYFDAVRDVKGRTLVFDCDCASINSVTNGDSSSVTSDQYATEPYNRTPYYGITLKASSGVTWNYMDDPEGAIAVSAKWAYSTTPPDDVVQACIRLAAYLFVQKDAQVFDVTASPELGVMTVPQGMPKDVRQLLAPYRRIT